MHSTFQTHTCRLLVAALFVFSLQAARADELPAADRSEAAAQLQAAGVAAQAANERVRNLNDEEVRTLAQDIEAAPAGGVAVLGWVAIAAAVGMLYFNVVRK